MAEFDRILSTFAPCLGLALLAPIFLANASGALDQSVAVNDLTATGLRQPIAKIMVLFGRALQFVATPCLFFHETRPFAALLLAGFLIGATGAAHAFWKALPPDRDRQLAQFLKNLAIVGGLLIAAGWRT